MKACFLTDFGRLEEVPMITRACAAVGAVALIVAVTVSSAFACGAGHHARASGVTKVSYITSSTKATR